MKNQFSENEFDIVKKIIHLGLIRAAASLSQLIKDEVELPDINFREEASEKHLLSCYSEEDHYYLLSTKIAGELPAESFLIFDNINAIKLWDIVLPENMAGNHEMQIATLKEVDNILTASVVTEFSDLFSLNTYGEVPESYEFNYLELDKFLLENTNNYDFSFSFQTNLLAKDTKLSADFIWSIKKAFLPILKRSIETQEIHQKIEKSIISIKNNHNAKI